MKKIILPFVLFLLLNISFSFSANAEICPKEKNCVYKETSEGTAEDEITQTKKDSCGKGGIEFCIKDCPKMSGVEAGNQDAENKKRAQCIAKAKMDCAQTLLTIGKNAISIKSDIGIGSGTGSGFTANETISEIKKLNDKIKPLEEEKIKLNKYIEDLTILKNQSPTTEAQKTERTKKINTMKDDLVNKKYITDADVKGKESDAVVDILITKLKDYITNTIDKEIKELTEKKETLQKALAEKEKKVEENQGACLAAATQEHGKATLVSLGEKTSKFDVSHILHVGNENKLTLIDSNQTTGEKSILDKIIKTIVQILGTLAILMLVIAGVLMITSEGDDNRLTKGKNIILYTVIGLLVAFCSYIIVQFIISFLFMSGNQLN